MSSTLARIFSAELDGIEARLIEIETDINVGLHSFTIVGLADKALSEAKERVNSALKNTGIKPPSRENRRIVVNLAPADLKKTGSQYDLGIALGYLLASGQVKSFDASRALFVGELALDGHLRPVNGALSIAHLAAAKGFTHLFLPESNAREAAIVRDISVVPARTLGELIKHWEGVSVLKTQRVTEIASTPNASGIDIADIKGQAHAKRALAIAAAGGHNLLMVGPPGTGKTMLAQALNSILPPLTRPEVLELTRIYSAAGLLGDRPFMEARPLRSPHQSASPAAVIGGGQNPRPGEISLAHRGVLFLDELPEFRRDILEGLRQPLEAGQVLISRARGNLILPSKFTLVAAMNPCPCGYAGDEEKACRCAAYEILKYQKKISGPLLDRIDLQITVPRLAFEDLRAPAPERASANALREQVQRARAVQTARLEKTGKLVNAELSSKEFPQLLSFTARGMAFLKNAFRQSLLSARGYYRVLKVAQTICDLEGVGQVDEAHLAEAFNYRLRKEE